MPVLFVTDRQNSPFFTERLISAARAANLELTLVSELPNQVSPWIFSESWAIPEQAENVVVMPFNECNFPGDGDRSWKGRVKFFITQAEHLRPVFSSRSIKCSAILDHPLCSVDPMLIPIAGDTPPIKILLPCVGEWGQEDIATLLPLLTGALAKDFEDLSPFEFVAECQPMHYRPVAGESVSYYDNSGAFLGRLLDSKIVCSISGPHVMEMSWLARMKALKVTNAVPMAECVLDKKIPKDSLLRSFTELGQHPYSHLKLSWCMSHQIALDESPMQHLFAFSSAFGDSAKAVVQFSPSEFMQILSSGTSYDDKKLFYYMDGQEKRYELLIEKLGKLASIIAGS